MAEYRLSLGGIGYVQQAPTSAARITDVLWQAIGPRLERFSPEQCANYSQNSGYALV